MHISKKFFELDNKMSSNKGEFLIYKNNAFRLVLYGFNTQMHKLKQIQTNDFIIALY